MPQALLTALVQRLVVRDGCVVSFDLSAISKDPVPGFPDGVAVPLMKRRRMTKAQRTRNRLTERQGVGRTCDVCGEKSNSIAFGDREVREHRCRVARNLRQWQEYPSHFEKRLRGRWNEDEIESSTHTGSRLTVASAASEAKSAARRVRPRRDGAGGVEAAHREESLWGARGGSGAPPVQGPMAWVAQAHARSTEVRKDAGDTERAKAAARHASR